MKHLRITLGVLVIIAIGIALTQISTRTNIKQNATIYTTIPPIQMIAEAIVGETAIVASILPPGSSPHTFEPTPQDIIGLANSTVVFAVGQGLDAWITDIAAAAGVNNVIHVDQDIVLRSFEESYDEEPHEEDHHDEHEEDYDEDEHEHGEFDPHYWLSPENAVMIAATIRDTLSRMNPLEVAEYDANYEQFKEDVLNANIRWESSLSTLDDTRIITFHEAWSYFASHFNLEIAATIEPSPGKQPTPQYLAELQDTISHEGVNAVFTEPQLASDIIASFIADTGAVYGILDPIGGVSERNTYIELIDYNIDVIVETL